TPTLSSPQLNPDGSTSVDGVLEDSSTTLFWVPSVPALAGDSTPGSSSRKLKAVGFPRFQFASSSAVSSFGAVFSATICWMGLTSDCALAESEGLSLLCWWGPVVL